MNPIRTNKPAFFGNDGDVLKSGQIFIGQPNQWPIDFPKTVTFQDSAGTQFTAQQPLTTNNQGQISYNGKAIIALVDGNYSMLVRDRNGVVVNDGYTPFIENTDAGGGSTANATQVGTLLSDIKQFNVTPGDTVRNVGKTTALDGLGAYWLVVSNTGGGGDDIDLIDFANGTQGQRIGNSLYSKDYNISSAVAAGFDPTPIASDIKDGSFDPAVMSDDISSGSFKPESAGIVFNGSQATVTQGDLSESGDGFYIVELNGFRTGMIYYKSGITNKSLIEFENSSGDPIFYRIQVDSSGDFTGRSMIVDISANTISFLSINITRIWKV